MKRIARALILALLITAEATMFQIIAVGLVGANPSYVTMPDIVISSPPPARAPIFFLD